MSGAVPTCRVLQQHSVVVADLAGEPIGVRSTTVTPRFVVLLHLVQYLRLGLKVVDDPIESTHRQRPSPLMSLKAAPAGGCGVPLPGCARMQTADWIEHGPQWINLDYEIGSQLPKFECIDAGGCGHTGKPVGINAPAVHVTLLPDPIFRCVHRHVFTP